MSEEIVAADSPALYSDEEAWMRFKYYIIVNHFGHVIHTIAYHSKRSEKELWHVMRECIATSELFLNSAYRPWLLDLLTGEALPVKANFISCYRQRGENPLYIDLPNPMNMASYEDRLVDWRT
ncbi:Ferric iron reductase FhuF-like transporter [compost metagenome]